MKRGEQTARCRELLPEVREYLDGLGPNELPISFDNWAAMADSTYVTFAHTIRRYDPVLAAEYMERRTDIMQRRRAAIANAKTSEERAAAAAEFGLGVGQVANIARRAGVKVRKLVQWGPLVAQLKEVLCEGPVRVIDLAAQLGVNKHSLYTREGRARMLEHFDIVIMKYGRTHCAYLTLKQKTDARNHRKRSR